jgi:hypothetical protein
MTFPNPLLRSGPGQDVETEVLGIRNTYPAAAAVAIPHVIGVQR